MIHRMIYFRTWSVIISTSICEFIFILNYHYFLTIFHKCSNTKPKFLQKSPNLARKDAQKKKNPGPILNKFTKFVKSNHWFIIWSPARPLKTELYKSPFQTFFLFLRPGLVQFQYGLGFLGPHRGGLAFSGLHFKDL